jgi:hypothetical protein
MPHPLTFDANTDFFVGGLGYEVRSETFNHAGGIALDTYKGGLDRAYLTERAYWRPSREWLAQIWVLIDGLAKQGFFNDILASNTVAYKALDRIDLTNANLTLRYAPVREFDVALYAAHNHTLLPNLWWQDYLLYEKTKLGFLLDGLEPIGTRRSTGRLTFNFHVAPGVTPYAIARADYRHEDGARGWEGTVGIKLDSSALGYLDASGTARDYFGTLNQLASLTIGTNFGSATGIDANVTGMRVEQPTPVRTVDHLYDVGATLWLDLKAIAEPLGDVRLLGTYQLFYDPSMTFQVFMARLGYRFRET